jgi:hypothetical protein
LAAQGQLVDDFTSGNLSPYTRTIVLAQNADPGIDFLASGGTLSVSRTYSSGGAAQQDVFLRNDFSLNIGYTLRVDATVAANASAYGDFGIAIAASATPTAAVWTSGTADARQDYIAVYVKRQTDAIGRAGFNGTVNAGGSTGTAGVPGLANLTGLFITRSAADTFSVGYTTASGDTTLFTYTGMNTSIGNALGFYSDMRSTASVGTLDNLRIEAVPEPGAMSLLALSGMGFVMMRRIGRNR